MKKRLLLITPKFYEIEKSIVLALENMHFDVVWIENKDLPFDYHGTNSQLKILRKLYFFLFFPRLRYINRQLKKINNLSFDILFSINCHIISSYLFKRLKEQNPNLFSILYLWDSVKMYSWRSMTKLFNKVYTFDPEDSKIFGWEYRPNFFIVNDSDGNSEKQHDLFLVGKFSPERFKILECITKQVSDMRCYFKILPSYKNSLHNSWVYFFLKKICIRNPWINRYILNYEVSEGIISRNYIFFNSIDYKDVQKELTCSNVVLDISFPEQKGYSHRLVESLAMNKKVITTNRYIKNENFYNPDQIRIIDNENPLVDYHWVKEKTDFQKNNCFADQELSIWIKSIMNVEIA